MDADDESYEEAVDTDCSYFYYLWGKSAELDGPHRYDEALEAYEKALVCDTGAKHVMVNLAMLLVRMGKRRQAAIWLEKIISQDPDSYDARTLLADLYISMGKTDDAAQIYKDILRETPENLNILLMLGSLYAGNREYEKAQDVLERVVAVDKESYIGYHYLARLYKELRFFDKALAAYGKALDLSWTVMLAFEAAELYEYQERYEEAIDLYRRILADDETDEKARGRLAGIYLRTDKIDMALQELQELREYASDMTKVDIAIGRLLLEHERFDEAIDLFTRMIKEEPGTETVRVLLAYAYKEKGDTEKAKEVLLQVAPAGRDYEDAVLMLVRLLRDEGSQADAEKALTDRIADETTRRLNFYVGLASLYHKQEKKEAALAVFQEAMQVYPGNTKVFFEYGILLDQLGDMDGALAQMEKVLTMNQEDPYALNYVGYTWADKGVHLEKALQYVEKAVSLRPEDGFIRDSLGWVYFKMGDMERAVRELEKAVEMEPDDPTINEHLGDAHLKSNRPNKALDAYKKAMGLYKEEEKKAKIKRKIQGLEDL